MTIENFYSILNLDPIQSQEHDHNKLLAKLMSRNAINQTLIRRFLKRHSNRPIVITKVTKTSSVQSPSRIQLKPRRSIQRSQDISTQLSQLSRIEVSKPEVTCFEPRRSEITTPFNELYFEKRKNSRSTNNVKVGIINFGLEKIQKNMRMTKIFFSMLNKCNKICFGKRIPLKAADHMPTILPPNTLTTSSQQFFWNDSLMIVKSQAILPRIKKIL